MSDYTYIDLLDEVDCSDRCEAVIALCELVDKLVADIQFLELECISTRHLLSQYMDKEEGELLRMVNIPGSVEPSVRQQRATLPG